MSEITLVTAYFDINRKNWSGFERDSNKYINYFKFWAKIKNRLIIFTQSQFVEELYNIRKSFGLEKQTQIVTIDNPINCNKNLYIKMKKIMQNELAINFHPYKETKRPEVWRVDYNYITCLKFYLVNKAINDFNLKNTVAWIDFGFNHGGNDGLINSEDFSFLWNYDFSPKIHLFSYKKIDIDRPIFDIVRSLDVYIRGNIMIAPSHLWPIFYQLTNDAMLSLLRCGFCDDDQTIELMAYKEKPELFEIHDINFWYEGLSKFSNQKFMIKQQEIPKNKIYADYRYKSRIFFNSGNYQLAWKYFKKYLKCKMKGSSN